MRFTSLNQSVITLLAICSIILSACQLTTNRPASDDAAITAEQPKPSLTDLQGIQQLKDLFNSTDDTPRLILLLSPK